MASYQFFIAALVLVLVQQCWCQNGATSMRTTPDPPELTLTPSESDGNGGRLSIVCGASSLGTGEVVSLTNIERRPFTTPNAAPVSVAGASALLHGGQAKPTSFTPQGANVSGGIGSTDSQKIITLTMSSANCADAGTYYCKAITQDASFSGHTYESEKNVTIEVSPGNVTATYDPSGTTNWVVNDTLLMRCNGIVGTVKDASQLEWRWQYQSTNGFQGVNNWQDYNNDIGDPDTDINTQSPLPSVSGSCYTRQVSELTRHLTEDDTGRQYRCYVINGRMSGLVFAQVFTVGTVRQPDTGTGGQSPSTGDGSEAPAKADVGAIVGGVIGALIVIVVIIVIVYFLVIRKRRQQDKPDPSKPADEQPPPGYSTGPDPHVAYSQPTRTNRFKKEKEDKARGQTNKAMDEADEKPYKKHHSPQPQDYDSKPSYETKPARYENDIGRDYDRNQGRRNRAYDDDAPRSRRYSSDDGGTDTNVNMNTSMHSMHSVGYGDPNLGTAI